MITVPLSYNEINPDTLSRVLKSYAGRHHEEIVKDLEQKLSVVTGSPNVLAVSSGTSAMHLALQVAGVRAGDHVIAPTFAYVATVSPVTYLGAKLLLVDSEPDTWNMDPSLVQEALNKLKKNGKNAGAVIVVHNYGFPAKLDELLTVTREYNVPLIEDAAESFGTTYHQRWTGTIGDIGVFSFNSNKNVTGFGGGALASPHGAWIDNARYLAAHARSPVSHYQHDTVGYNYRMSPLTAAYILSQLEMVPALLAKRSEICNAYRTIGEKMGVKFQVAPPGSEAIPWLPACLLPAGFDIETKLNLLTAKGMEGRRVWKPMHTQPAFQEFQVIERGLSSQFFDRGICLPAGSISSDPPHPEHVLEVILTR